MIRIKEFPDMQFATKQEMFKTLVENKNDLIAQKKMKTKFADAVVYLSPVLNAKGEAIKADSIDIKDINNI